MNKQELLTTLTAEHYYIGSPVAQPGLDVNGFITYVVPVLDVDGENMRRSNIAFIVEDEGGPGETAYWQDRKPGDPIPTDQFTADLKTFIALKIANGTIEAAFLDSIDRVNEKATGWGYRDNAGQLLEVRVIFYRDGNGDVVHRVVDSPLKTS